MTATQTDVDPKDSPEKPWRREGDAKVRVVFETHALSDRYRQMVTRAADIWSASPCIAAVAADRCAEGDNCVRVVEQKADGRSTDGEFKGKDGKKYRHGGKITLYTALLDRNTDQGALATVVHEMGHALGLVHRLDTASVMNSHTDQHTNPIPDATDFANLAVIYGREGPAQSALA
ncbi:matrixin family metalloprotease [Georgenia ruanii]|uniref:Matrixin family metalloprotease n=1 Tax=Georgenia ruanii TaxID=348442 RepID=A0A7J9UTF2_9MICO|nr:matrixin family metalloprotease [Georgenia ruanii]MPV87878.1 matrixin family metalloprotease [Georgenia ruanii]